MRKIAFVGFEDLQAYFNLGSYSQIQNQIQIQNLFGVTSFHLNQTYLAINIPFYLFEGQKGLIRHLKF